MAKKKNAAAVALGRRGGANSRINLTPEKRTALAKKAAAARWKGKDAIADKPRNEPLPPKVSKKLMEKAAIDPKWKNKTSGAKKI